MNLHCSMRYHHGRGQNWTIGPRERSRLNQDRGVQLGSQRLQRGGRGGIRINQLLIARERREQMESCGPPGKTRTEVWRPWQPYLHLWGGRRRLPEGIGKKGRHRWPNGDPSYFVCMKIYPCVWICSDWYGSEILDLELF